MLKKEKKIQLSKFGDLIDFNKEVINWAASHLARRWALQGFVLNGMFLMLKDARLLSEHHDRVVPLGL